MLLTRGDDYELCFTVSNENESAVLALAEKHQLQISYIGDVTDSDELVFIDENNKPFAFPHSGFKHF